MKCEMARVVNANYVRYETLTPLIIENFKGSGIDTMAIYIDMYSICKSLYNDNVVIEDYTALTSSIVNMVAHYRDFFRRMGVDTVFFIINSMNHAHLNTQFVSGYNDKEFYKMMSNSKVYDMIYNNNELLELLCKYLPGIYYLDRTTEVSTIIYDIMCKFDINNRYAHMIISKDIYTWQLVTTKPNTVVLRPKKKDGTDISYIVNKSNLLQMYYLAKNIKKQSSVISPELFTLILAATSLPERNIKSLVSSSKIIQGLQTLILDNAIVNGYNSDPLFVYQKLESMGIKISPFIADARFKAIDVVYQQLVFMNTLEADYSKEFVNLRSKEDVQAINNKYFQNYPLDLNRL